MASKKERDDAIDKSYITNPPKFKTRGEADNYFAKKMAKELAKDKGKGRK